MKVSKEGSVSFLELKRIRRITLAVYIAVALFLVYGYGLGTAYDADQGLTFLNPSSLSIEGRFVVVWIVLFVLHLFRMLFCSGFEYRQIKKMSRVLYGECDLEKYTVLSEGVSSKVTFKFALSELIYNRAYAFALLGKNAEARTCFALLEKWYFTQKNKNIIAWLAAFLCSIANVLDDKELFERCFKNLAAFINEDEKNVYMKRAVEFYRNTDQRLRLEAESDYTGLLTWVNEQVSALDPQNRLNAVTLMFRKSKILLALDQENEAIECLEYVIENGSQLKQAKEANAILDKYRRGRTKNKRQQGSLKG